MQESELWRRYQERLYFHEGLGVYLDLSRMPDVPASDRALSAGLPRAFAAMAELERGGLANPDEQRMEGHYR
jgi:glucose-6-phosphate isomerase